MKRWWVRYISTITFTLAADKLRTLVTKMGAIDSSGRSAAVHLQICISTIATVALALSCHLLYADENSDQKKKVCELSLTSNDYQDWVADFARDKYQGEARRLEIRSKALPSSNENALLANWIRRGAQGSISQIFMQVGVGKKLVDEGVLITQLPEDFPRSTKVRFAEVSRLGVPTIITSKGTIPFFALAVINFLEPFNRERALGYIAVTKSIRAIELDHEMVHAVDFILEPEKLIESIGPIPHSMVRLIEKNRTLTKLTWFERKKLKALADLPSVYSECRASAGTVRTLVTPDKLIEILKSPSRLKNIWGLYNDSVNLAWRKIQKTYYILMTNPCSTQMVVVPLDAGLTTVMIFEVSSKFASGVDSLIGLLIRYLINAN